jgi:hypothetical protein
MRQRIHGIVAALAAIALVTACAAEDRSPADSVAQQGGSDAPHVVNVVATDFAFDMPSEVPAGMTTFRLASNGPNFHHAIVARLDSGKTMADLEAAFSKPGPPPAWLVMLGGPNPPPPGGQSNATVDLEPGNYALLCLVDVPGGVPHIAKGMVKPFTVTAARGRAPAPVADVRVKLVDYSFQIDGALTPGTHTVEVVTDAAQLHELAVFRLDQGKTQDLMAWMEKMDGPPPAQSIGGTAPSAPGVKNYFTADFPKGEYVFICFVPAPDGKMHFQHGMLQTISVQ